MSKLHHNKKADILGPSIIYHSKTLVHGEEREKEEDNHEMI